MQDVLSRILTVSELTRQIRSTLEDQFPVVWVEGQISNLRRPSSGHQYFTLKDQSSQIRVVLFRGVAQHLSFSLEEGLDVIIRGSVTAYELRGDYQLILQSVEPKGIGSLQLAFEQVKVKLEKEGLFDLARKRPLPSFPLKIGIITSRHGAALHDILNIVHRRCPMISILIYPVLVQGMDAARQIAHAIHVMNTVSGVEVLIVGRGGGSLEDLWSFNEEVVVRAIAESKIPVISAVGHETDVTLADLAADLRAPTPSAAAELVAPSSEDMLVQIRQLVNRLTRSMHTRLQRDRHAVESTRSDLPDPVLWLYRYGQRVDDLEARLGYMVRNFHKRLRVELTYLASRVMANTPQHRTQAGHRLIPQLWVRMLHGMHGVLKEKQHQSRSTMAILHTLSPFIVLSRGYSIVEDLNRKTLVKSVNDVTVGDHIHAKLVDGTVECLVEAIKVKS
ncbi:MAG: exodeoxyribonuclease 7 large subunit [Nitrospirales bacterium]|nr:MAG: exodeoxyribonuclease 7 large subunit [Nitrospirales bacterium]